MSVHSHSLSALRLNSKVKVMHMNSLIATMTSGPGVCVCVSAILRVVLQYPWLLLTACHQHPFSHLRQNVSRAGVYPSGRHPWSHQSTRFESQLQFLIPPGESAVKSAVIGLLPPMWES